MAGNANSGVSSKRKTLPKQFRPGLMQKADKRAKEVRIYFARLERLCADQGGEDEMSVVLQSVAERFVFAEARLSRLEAKAWKGATLDPNYDAAVATFVRLADRLGFIRKARPLPNALEYVAQRAAENAAGLPAEEEPT